MQGHHKESTGDLDGDSLLKLFFWTSSQDGGIGRYTLPPHTTKRRTTTNLKTNKNQNYKKIQLYGSLTTKEFKKEHSFRVVGGAGSQVERMLGKVPGGGWGKQGGSWQSHICVQINQEEQLGSERLHNLSFQHGEIKLQNF